MLVSAAQKKATAKHEQQKYDKFSLTLDNGEKDRIKNHAESNVESLNGFVKRSIDETTKRDKVNIKNSASLEIRACFSLRLDFSVLRLIYFAAHTKWSWRSFAVYKEIIN